MGKLFYEFYLLFALTTVSNIPMGSLAVCGEKNSYCVLALALFLVYYINL